jgi:RNA polymerase sigma-70 factor (ECF subfamily)
VERRDAHLIELARRGSSEAAGELFERHWRTAWKAAYALTADRALADDIAQDALQRAFGSLRGFDTTRPFWPWLKRIVVNVALDALRRRGELAPLEADELAGGAIEEPGGDLTYWAVAEAVAALEPRKRTVIVLRYWLDFGVEEIAELLDVPVGTVASRLSRAYAELRVHLREDCLA